MNGKRWRQEHTDTLTRMAGHYTDEEIAGQTGHKPVTVFYRRKGLGLPACQRIDWTKRRVMTVPPRPQK